MGLINDENYINVQGWMVNKLHLKGNELLVYAIIYGYSQGENGKFEGSLQYLADWCGATKQGILKNINSLLQKDLIKKEVVSVNGLNYVKYYTTEIREMPLNKVERGIKQSLTPIKQSLTNNIVNNIDNNTSNNFTIINSKVENRDFLTHPKKPKKSIYSKCVDLINNFTTDCVLRELLERYLKICLENSRESNTPFYTNNFKGKLNTLKKLSSDIGDQINIVKTSIDKGWSGLYSIKSNNNFKNSYKFQDNIEPDTRDLTGKEFEEVNEGF